MNRFDREHVDGIGDGLSIALGIVRAAKTPNDAERGVLGALSLAREAKDRDNLARLKEMVTDAPSAPTP